MLTFEFIDPEAQIQSSDFAFVESFLHDAQRRQIGWHYITDMVWIYSQAKNWPKSYKVLDAGGGTGPVQFMLAEMGFHVTNVDMALIEPAVPFRDRYKITRRSLPSFRPTSYKDFLDQTYPISSGSNRVLRRMKDFTKSTSLYRLLRSKIYARRHDRWRAQYVTASQPIGSIQWLVGNLCNMPELETAEFDAVVSMSAWEHIPLDALDAALVEIRRVLKPNAKWAVTTSGTEQSQTWWHEPSKSYAFSNDDFTTRFAAQPASSQDAETILERYRKCRYLQDHLSAFYKKSGDNGMPWGIWDPKYIPVGLQQ
ncbi:MAG: class I SAM-dependent methyltransferase [Pirellulaceae bacterium]|nr:class I SAM-dependent methyltransferase [Pirellulaceae bacterium]